jgi:hypothetical protein
VQRTGKEEKEIKIKTIPRKLLIDISTSAELYTLQTSSEKAKILTKW